MTKKSSDFEFAALLDGKGGARKLTVDEVGNWKESDGVLWIDLDQGKKSTERWLTSHSNILKGATDILLASETRPRSLIAPDGLIVIMRGINMNPGAMPDDMVAVRLWLDQNRIVTSHRRAVLSISDLQDALAANQGPRSSGDFLISLISNVSGRIGDAVNNIEDMIDEVESELATGDVNELRTTLGIVRRQAAAIRRYVSPQRDALDRLTRADIGVLSATESYSLREEADQLTRHLEDLDLEREHALVTQEELMNRVAHEQNVRMYLLSVVAVIFLPLTFVTGLLGMNVAGLPGLDNPDAFAYSVIVMAIFGISLVVFFKWKKWI